MNKLGVIIGIASLLTSRLDTNLNRNKNEVISLCNNMIKEKFIAGYTITSLCGMTQEEARKKGSWCYACDYSHGVKVVITVTLDNVYELWLHNEDEELGHHCKYVIKYRKLNLDNNYNNLTFVVGG